MLRVTMTEAAGVTTIRVDGRLANDVAGELDGACRRAQRPLVLDLTELMTEVFLGQPAAERSTAALRAGPPEPGAGTVFSPAPEVECVRESGLCLSEGEVHEGLTAVLYAPWSGAGHDSAEAAATVGVDWRWLETRYSDDTAARPADPARYLVRLEPDGSLHVQADCNAVGGGYQLDANRITIGITSSTMAACEPGSLEGVFLQDLSAASVYPGTTRQEESPVGERPRAAQARKRRLPPVNTRSTISSTVAY